MLIFYDLETTGLNQFHDKITEMCFIKQDGISGNNDTFTTLVNPEIKISQFITKLTGIDNSMVATKPTFNQLSNQIIHFINHGVEKDCPIYFVAHNNEGFDKRVLFNHFKRAGINMNHYNWIFLDTLLLAKKMYPEFRKHNLKNLCEKLGVQMLDAHRAEADTKMLRDLFFKMVMDLEKNLKMRFPDIVNNPQIIYDYYN